MDETLTTSTNNDTGSATGTETTVDTTTNTQEATTPTNTEQSNTQETTAPTQYDFTQYIGDGEVLDEANANAFSEVLRNLNIDQAGAEQLTNFGMQYLQQMGEQVVTAIEQQQQAQADTWKQETVNELGGKFDATIASAGAGIEYLEKDIPNLREVLSINGIGNNLALVKVFAKIGELVAEDSGRLGGTGTGPADNFYDNTDFSQYK